MPTNTDYYEPGDMDENDGCPECCSETELDNDDFLFCTECEWHEDDYTADEAALAELRLQHSYQYGPHRQSATPFCPPELPEPSQMELL